MIAWVNTPFSTYTICLINLPTGYHITSPTGALDREEAFEVISLCMSDNSEWVNIEREMISRGLIDRDDCYWPRERVREVVKELLFFEEMYVVEGMDYWWEPIPGYFGVIEPKEKEAHDAAASVAPELFSPRWGHVDVGRHERTSQSSYAEHGDYVNMVVSVRGVPDGERVSFCITDSHCDRATGELLDRVDGWVDGGSASARWKVRDRRQPGDSTALQLGFYASMRDLTTEAVEIPVRYTVAALGGRRYHHQPKLRVRMTSLGASGGEGEVLFEGQPDQQGLVLSDYRVAADGKKLKLQVVEV